MYFTVAFFNWRMEISKLQNLMKEKGVLTGSPFPPLTDWCRISTGKEEDVHRFCESWKEVMA